MPITPASIGEPVADISDGPVRRIRLGGQNLPRPQARSIELVDPDTGKTVGKYDPDEGNRAEDFATPAHEYAQRFVVSSREHDVEIPGIPGKIRPVEVAGVFQEYVPRARRWKPVQIASRETLKQFYESRRGKIKRTVESIGFSFDSDNDIVPSDPMNATGLIDTEYVPLMAGPFYKQMYIYDYLKMHARAFNLKNHNALAAAAVKLLTRFTLGRGVSFHIKNDRTRSIWQEFWDRNNMRHWMRIMAADLSWQGELMLKYIEQQTGFVTLKVLDPSTCWEVVTDPEDLTHVFYYHFQWSTPYQIYTQGQIPITKYLIQQIPPTNIQHLKINASAQEKRGRSELLPAMAWLKRFDDFYNGETLKRVLGANLVWKIKVLGDQADVDSFLSNPNMTQLPPPGGIWLENEAVNLEAVTAEAGANVGRGTSTIGAEIAGIIACSLNLPSEYFNIAQQAGGAARATALVRTDPAVKTIEDRQQIFREQIEEMYDRVMSAARNAGRLTTTDIKGEPETTPDQSLHGFDSVGDTTDHALARGMDMMHTQPPQTSTNDARRNGARPVRAQVVA